MDSVGPRSARAIAHGKRRAASSCEHDLGSTQMTCAPEEQVDLSAWLAAWLVAYRGRKPLPARPLPAEGWKRQASDRAAAPWGDNVWTQRARALYATRWPST